MRMRPGFMASMLITACATGGGGTVGSVELGAPQPAHGDDRAIAWPFTVIHDGGAETLADFHLRIESGGALLGVRPDGENPDPGARFAWRGELRNGEAYWIGDPVAPGGSVTLTLLLRPEGDGEPRLRVVHWPTDGRDHPVGPEVCEIWTYDVRREKIGTTGC